jgi:macrolide transport system ATP-binding/permease protein
MMDKLSQLWRRLLFYARRERFDRELEEEIRFHLEMKAQENVEAGVNSEEARYAAQRQFGNQTFLQEVSREMWRARFIETLMQDLRYGARMLLKNPGFTLIAVLTLAIGVSANTVVFSIINAVLFRPRPVAEPERLVELYSSDARNPYGGFSYPDYLSFRDQGEVFSGLAAYRPGRYKLDGEDGVEPVIGEAVSGNYFDVLGVKAINGRAFLPEEDRTPGSHPVVVIGHDLWRRRFNADPALIGKPIKINNQALTVIGVAPPEYTGMLRGLAAELWVPVMMIPRLGPVDDMARLNNRGDNWLFIVGRLKPEATLEGARARFDLISAQLRGAYPEFWRQTGATGAALEKSVTILPEHETRIHPGEGAGAYAFMAVVLAIINMVMLIACLNLANLLLARATARGKEMAVRLALGAARWRIVRQLLTESMELTALAAAAGVLLAMWLMNVLTASLPAFQGIRFAIDLQLDWRVLLYTSAFSFLVSLLFGLAPALQASRLDVIVNLKDGANVFAGARRQSRLRNGLIVAQVALSVVSLVGAGLVMRSARNLNPLNQGYDSLNMVVAPIKLEERLYDRARSQDFYRRLAERTRALPGVRDVVFAARLPTPGLDRGRSPVGIEGYQPSPGEDMALETNAIGPGYLTAMNIPITNGRDFDEHDREDGPCVAVVNEALARRYFPGGQALGKRLIKRAGQRPDQLDQLGQLGQLCEIVGVVRDDKFQSLRTEPLPWYGFALSQSLSTSATMLVRTEGPPENLVPKVRRAIQALDQTILVNNVLTLNDSFRPLLYFYRMFGLLVGGCGLLAIILAVIGIYGMVAYTVSRRTREIGIRMALGADKNKILRLVVRQGMVLVVCGLSVGLLLALALAQILTSSIFEIPILIGVKATDPLTFGSTALLLIVTALLACYFPARRATKVDPMAALRIE